MAWTCELERLDLEFLLSLCDLCEDQFLICKVDTIPQRPPCAVSHARPFCWTSHYIILIFKSKNPGQTGGRTAVGHSAWLQNPNP